MAKTKCKKCGESAGLKPGILCGNCGEMPDSSSSTCSTDTPLMEIVRGDIIMANGSDLDLYLMEWQKANNHPDFTPVRILTHQQYKDLKAAAKMAGIA